MKTPNVTDVEVIISAGKYALSCQHNGARYHVWLSRPERVLEPTLYKNSLANYDEPGYYQTRRLNFQAEHNKELLAVMQSVAEHRKLFEAAEQAEADRLAQEAKERDAHIERGMKEQAGPDLYDALAAIVLRLLHESQNLSLAEDTRDWLLDTAKLANAALLKAKPVRVKLT